MRLLAWVCLACLGPLRAAAAPDLFIDPGHGGADRGVCAGAACEADLAFDVATQLAAALKAQNIECVLSRDASESPAPSERVMAANASGARAMLSLHLNHSPSPSVRGPRIFIPKPLPAAAKDEPRRWNKAGGQRSEEAKGLAGELAKALSQSESAKVSVQNLDLVVFKGLAIPGVLCEMGFLSHAESRDRFSDAEYRKAVAAKLAEAVLAWLKPAGTNPAAVAAPAPAGKP